MFVLPKRREENAPYVPVYSNVFFLNEERRERKKKSSEKHVRISSAGGKRENPVEVGWEGEDRNFANAPSQHFLRGLRGER